jgi:hypothetical protein
MKIKDKTEYLKRIVWLWVGYFSTIYTHSDVLVGRKFITVKLWSMDGKKKKEFDDSEFPISLLGRTISMYKRRVRSAFNNRHNKSK